MKYTLKKTLAFLLILMMVVNLFPLSVVADEGGYNPPLLRGTNGAIEGGIYVSLQNDAEGTMVNGRLVDPEDNSQFYYTVITNSYGNILGYSAIPDNFTYSNSGTQVIPADHQIYVAKAAGNTSFSGSIQSLSSPNALISESGTDFGAYRFSFSENGNNIVITASNPSAALSGNVTIDMEYHINGTFTPDNYYVSVGPFDGPYDAKNIKTDMPASASYAFNVPDECLTSHYFVAFRTATSLQDAQSRGSLEVTTFYFASDSTNEQSGTSTFDDGKYSVTWSRVSDHHYKFVISETTVAHTVTMSAEDGVDTTYIHVILKQRINNQDFYYYRDRDVWNSTTQVSSLFLPHDHNQTVAYNPDLPIEAYVVVGDQYYDDVIGMISNADKRKDDGDLIGDKQLSIVTNGVNTTVSIGAPQYGASIQFLKAWDEGETTVSGLDGITVIATEEDGTTTHTGSLTGSGNITFTDPLPNPLTSWRFEQGGNEITSIDYDGRTYVLPTTATLGSGNVYQLTAQEANTYSVRIDYYDGWAQTPETSVEVPAGTITATDANGTDYTGTIATDGSVTFDNPLPEIDHWSINGETDIIGEYNIAFGENNPTVDSSTRSYVIKASKLRTYSATLSFYSVDGTEPLQDVELSTAYTIQAVPTDDTLPAITGTIGTDGQLTWENNVSTLPKISGFKFYNGDQEVTWLDNYAVTVESYEDDDLIATNGTYQINARIKNRYYSWIKYIPEHNATDLDKYYYIIASIDGVKTAYAPVPKQNGELVFSLVGSRASGIQLPEDAVFTLVKSDTALNAETIADADDTEYLIDGYALTLIPEIEQIDEGNGSDPQDRLVFTASKRWEGNTFQITTYDFNGEDPITPDPAITGEYYLRVRILDKNSDVFVGWTLIPVSWNAAGDTTTVTVDKFISKDASFPTAGTPMSESDWITFDSDRHYIEVDTEDYPARIITIDNKTWINWGQATAASNVNDDPPAGFKYDKGKQLTNGNYEIRLQRARPLVYHVRLKFNTADTSKIKLDGGLYVRVTIDHQSGSDTYGWVNVSEDAEEYLEHADVHENEGFTYIDIPVTEWKDAQGNTLDGETYKGTEKAVKVELVGVPTAGSAVPNPSMNEALSIGQYVNQAELIAYPTGALNVDHFEIPRDESEIPDEQKTYATDIYDVVTLNINTDAFPEEAYSLEYILNGFNLIALCPPSDTVDGTGVGDGDVELVTHCMGGVLVRGDLIDMGGGSIADASDLRKPSVVGGSIPTKTQTFVNGRKNRVGTDVPFYVGTDNTVVGYIVNGVKAQENYSGTIIGYNAGGETIVSDHYIDWDRLQSMVIASSGNMINTAKDTIDITSDNQQSIVVGYGTSTKFTLDSSINDQVIIKIKLPWSKDDPDLKAHLLDPDAPATILNFGTTEDMDLPKVEVIDKDGNEVVLKDLLGKKDIGGNNTVEIGDGMSIVLNIPYSTKTVTIKDSASPVLGHVLAPKAFIKTVRGDYNGALVGNKIHVEAEGHSFPYKGGSIIPANVGFKATKTMDEKTPKKNFTYKMERFSTTGASPWTKVSEAQNVDRTITFNEIQRFDMAGTYYFRIYEVIPETPDPSVTYDETEYVVKIEVTADPEDVNQLVETTTYYKVDDKTNLVTTTTNEDTTTYTLNETALSAPISLEDDETSADAIKFNNKEKKSGLTIAKRVVSPVAADHSATYTFTIQLSDTSINGTIDGVNFENGEATVSVAGDDSITIAGLPVGTDYTVTEVTSSLEGKFITTSENENGTIQDSGTTVTFTNTRKTGSLTVTKTVTASDNNATILAKTFYFTVKIGNQYLQDTAGTLGNNPHEFEITNGAANAVSFPSLPVGTYTVTETRTGANEDAQEENYSLVASGGGDVEVEKDGDASTTLTNAYTKESKGVITLTKTGANSAKLAGAKFDLYRVKTGDETADVKINTADLVTDGNGQITVDNLEPGTYYFKETQAPSGYVTPTGHRDESRSGRPGDA